MHTGDSFPPVSSPTISLNVGMAAAVLMSVVVGVEVSPEAQLVALTLILVAGIVVERRPSVDHSSA